MLTYRFPASSVTIPSETAPALLHIDPQVKVLFTIEDLNPGEDILRNLIVRGPNIFHKVWATKELLKVRTI